MISATTRKFNPCIFLASLLLITILSISACKKSEPIKIGFIGGISGRYSSLGIEGRNGAELAVSEINASGGLNGQPVELLVEDDQQEASALKKAIYKLHGDGAVAIVGPFTSSMAIEAAPIASQLEIVVVGPTVSTNNLSGKDDFFFRPRPASKVLAQRIARYMVVDKGIKRLNVVSDIGNRAHVEPWFANLKLFFEEYGGEINRQVTFNSTEQNSYTELAMGLLKVPADGYFVLANSIDSGLIAQQLRKQGAQQPLFASEWSFTNDLLQFGGSAVEGLTICHTYNLFDPSPRFEDFKRRYLNRFGSAPSFAAGHSYDATHLILEAMKIKPDPQELKKTLLSMDSFQGLQSTIKFNKFGDTERDSFFTTIKNGNFVVLEQ